MTKKDKESALEIHPIIAIVPLHIGTITVGEEANIFKSNVSIYLIFESMKYPVLEGLVASEVVLFRSLNKVILQSPIIRKESQVLKFENKVRLNVDLIKINPEGHR